MGLIIREKNLFFIICCAGILLRYYNYSYDDLWYDEVISFWISNPELTFFETINYNRLVDVNTSAYHFILKFFFLIFGYSVESGRLLSVIFGTLSIFSVGYLSWMISKNASFLLSVFLISFNIFLISYSQEMRVYSILFFFSSLFLIFFLLILDDSKNYLKNTIYIFISIIFISLHPFSLIVFFSCLIYLILKHFKHYKEYLNLYFCNFLILVSAFLIYFSAFFLISDSNGSLDYFWQTNPDLGFYTNFYFSSFFGSRIMGLIFLIILLLLIIKNYRKILKIEIETLLVLIIFLSYFLPIIFGYIYRPIIVNRYIIFVLIPIVIITSHFIFDLQNRKIKLFLIIFLSIITVGNHFTEQTFKQFFKERIVSKPQYTLALKYINESNYKNYILKVTKMKNEEATKNALNHYISYLNSLNNFDLEFSPNEKKYENTFLWHICLQDFNGKNCEINDIDKKFKVIEIKNFNNIELKLIKII